MRDEPPQGLDRWASWLLRQPHLTAPGPHPVRDRVLDGTKLAVGQRVLDVGIVLFSEDGRVVARRDGDEDIALLDEVPDGRVRAAAALANPNAGEVLVSAASGWEFDDLAGRHHHGGGSHGSLEAADSEVPMLTVGLGAPPSSITGVKPLVAHHFGVAVRRAA